MDVRAGIDLRHRTALKAGGGSADQDLGSYYLPSNPDNFYREGDYRASTGRIGKEGGTDPGGYRCPEGYAAVGLQGRAGLAIDRGGLIRGKIGGLSRLAALPVLGGDGLRFMTGIGVRSGLWDGFDPGSPPSQAVTLESHRRLWTMVRFSASL